jgi:hypothetical protein
MKSKLLGSALTIKTARWSAIATALVAFTCADVQAATLQGDIVTLAEPTGTIGNYLVSSGVDYSPGPLAHYDFSFGVLADHLRISFSEPDLGSTTTTFFGFYAIAGTSTITLSSLDFSGGEVLTGFNVLSSIYPITVNILTPHSLSLSWTEGGAFTPPVTFLEGEFVTSQAAATPLPGTLPLFAGGLGALGLLGWRRKKKAAALAA